LLLGFGDGILMPIITTFLMFKLGISVIGMGITFSVAFGIAMALSQIPGAKITETFGKKLTILAGILMATPLLVLLPFTTSLIQFVAILGLNNFIGYLWSPALAAWVADSIETDRRGKAYGFKSAAYGMGSIAGPAIGGILWTLFQPNTLLPFIIATIPFFLIIPIIVILKE
jgi:DHA1 family tetracycline resistance protein-like MFS transporter